MLVVAWRGSASQARARPGGCRSGRIRRPAGRLLAGTAGLLLLVTGCGSGRSTAAAGASRTPCPSASPGASRPGCRVVATESPTESASAAAGQRWTGTVEGTLTDASPAGTCVGKVERSVKLSVGGTGAITGTETVVSAPVDSCGRSPLDQVGYVYQVTGRETSTQLILSAQTPFLVQHILVHAALPRSGNTASGTGDGHGPAPGQTTLTESDTFQLACTNC